MAGAFILFFWIAATQSKAASSPTVETWRFRRLPTPSDCPPAVLGTIFKARALRYARDCAGKDTCLAYKCSTQSGQCGLYEEKYTDRVTCHDYVYQLEIPCVNGDLLNRSCVCHPGYTGICCNSEITCKGRDPTIVSADTGNTRPFSFWNPSDYPVDLYVVDALNKEVMDRSFTAQNTWYFYSPEGRVYIAKDEYGQYAAFGDSRECQFVLPSDPSQTSIAIYPQKPPTSNGSFEDVTPEC